MENEKEFIYYVLSTKDEANAYIETLEKAKKRMAYMQKAALSAVEHRWYTQTWSLKGNVRKLIK